MAAYAALVSLANLMEDIQSHPRLSTSLDENQIESLSEKVDFLLRFVESYSSHGGSKEAEDLESQIASAAHAVEDVIESHLVDQIVAGSTIDHGERSSHSFSLNLERETQEIKEQMQPEDVKPRLQHVTNAMDSIKSSIMEVESKGGLREKLPEYSVLSTSAGSLTSSKTTTVGFYDESIQLLERLIRPEPHREIIPIAGMGGTGKTTLARLIFEHPLIAQHFDIFTWATISQEYSLEIILYELLYGKKESTSQTVNELGENLHKKLWGRRYLVILDDMWSLETWNEIQMFLPDNGNGDRVVITTRLSNVATHLSSSPFKMNFLDEDKSWKLFCAKAFGEEEDCPPELEEIGRNIVKKCRGLALSIVVIGGHLRKSSRMKGYWESVGNDINSILDSGKDEEQCLSILSLSYNHLPTYLKPCFLYMGIFEEDKEIYAPRLTDLWIVEGLLKPNKDKCKEEIAEDYLKDLVDRNLILATRRDHTGKYDVCKIHDLLRELSIKEATKEKFFCVLDATPTIDSDHHRVVIYKKIPEEKHDPEIFHALRSAPLVRSLKCEGGDLSSHLRLLRVLINKVKVVLNGDSLEPNFQQVNLRYFDCHFVRSTNVSDGNRMPNPSLRLPPSISLLWNLQTLRISGAYDKIIAPFEIWKMSQLRHLDVRRICLPDPHQGDGLHQQDDYILQKLHTLKQVENFSLSEDVCKRIPNIKQLDLSYDVISRASDEESSCYCPHNLGCFHKLESLWLSFSGKLEWYYFARSITFPLSLQKLVLINSYLRWEDLRVIGSLPHLVDLELFNSTVGSEWNPIEMGFPCLKSLFIYGCRNLVSWNADSSHFPVLEDLFIMDARKLDEFPSTIGEIPTLQYVKLQSCTDSAAISALRMLVEQEELGNDCLKLEVTFKKKEELESFKEIVQEEGLTCSNLRLSLSGVR